ncbi:hypothetical protein J40TS1_37250 [Paenibacillus montaniterrae]|uniref:DUF4180 domain-containing protein n=1 Tax=Paenibacillus montaniterrae TaxID=429341 RepID=A0A920D023_9BACL|nr:DUF4180 domain-containing protein [Paenibacillus montaniterrae]GIP18083.1 hypothetical protein J40TS1_37250 [Paenibacillus montaniterrae]
MNITTINRNDVELALVSSSELLITDVQSALDLIATVSYETGCNRIIINKSAIIEDFFDLKTKILGEITQKFINYQIKMAIVGDFSAYTSKSLKDYIYESNSGKNFFFLESEEQAIEKLSSIR